VAAAPAQRFEASSTDRQVLPGVILAVAGAAAAWLSHELFDIFPVLMVALLLGAVLSNIGVIPRRARHGLKFTSRKLLRVGIVLLGFRLSLSQVGDLGPRGLAVVVVVVASTFFGTQWLGRRMGITPGLSLLVATGFAICGASAIAAMEGVADAEEEEVTYAVALVTLCGSLAVVVLPWLSHLFGMGTVRFGAWVGASVHDVGQVVAASSVRGKQSLATATLVKLTRVVLLAPMVVGMSVWRARRSDLGVHGADPTASRRPPMLPLFVVGFLVAIVIRTTDVLSADTLSWIKHIETVLFAAALFALGSDVLLSRLRRVGGRPLVLGLVSWALIAVVGYGGVMVAGF
jgi:uncharacterized integral membrane protein (TIGR00698 family)